MKVIALLALCAILASSLVKTNATYVPNIEIGSQQILYGWGASTTTGTYDAVFDPSLGGDQTQLLQEGLNILSTNGGGTLTVLSGTYILQGNIELYNNMKLQGQGIDVTTFQLIDNAIDFHYAGFLRAEMMHDVIISDLTINGNKNGQSLDDADNYGKYGIFTEGSIEIWFDYVRVTEMNHYGFDPHGHKTIMFWGQNLTITNCISDNNGWDGFTLDQTFNIVAENNLASNNGRHGYNVVTGSGHALIQNNIAIDNGYYYVPPPAKGCGITVQNNFQFGTKDVHIIGNTLINNNFAGICLNNVSNIIIEDNEITESCICYSILYGGYVSINDNLCSTETLFQNLGIEIFDDVTASSTSTVGIFYSTTNNEFEHQITCSTIAPPPNIPRNYWVGFNLSYESNTSFSIADPLLAKTIIQYVLNQIHSNGGGVLNIDSGEYIINETIVIYSNTHLQGAGIDETFLILSNNASTFINGNAGFIRSRQTNAVTISDLTLDGNTPDQCCLSECEYGRSGLFMEATTNLLVENVRTTNFQLNGMDIHGWSTTPAQNIQIINCFSDNNNYNGISLNQVNNVSVTGAHIFNNGANGIYVNNTIYFSGGTNSISGNGYLRSGCGLDLTNTPYSGVQNINNFGNNYLSTNKKGGICVSASDGYIFNNDLSGNCICFNFVAASFVIDISDNSCVGYKLILSTPAFVMPAGNAFTPTPCSNASTGNSLNLVCVNDYYSTVGVSTSSGTAIGSSTGSAPGSSTGSSEPGSSGSAPESSTGSSEPESSTGSTEPESSTASSEPESSTGSTEPESSTGSTEPESSTGSTEPESSTGSTESESSTGSTEPESSTGSTESESSTGSTESESSTGSAPESSTGSTSESSTGSSTGKPKSPNSASSNNISGISTMIFSIVFAIFTL
ncbi:MAG: hypothetical protein Harvfovirus12_27 [Harvfovirus sp.]|uniref:Right handed beta helix domain-containing protein n=1 Tax=Harvfovirus sp. TaxID=2487768 RepID=A0A3G5A451_9VIRU|nr:MAG: hypothetical protein Harvfovirus12_27 [Harvfovirus sp.]